MDLGGIGSIIGGIAGAASTKYAADKSYKAVQETNQANKEIAQMSNDFNLEMFKRQIDYNTSMWNKQNEYNSPENQRKLREAAGLNPYENIGSGVAGSAGGVNPPSAVTPTMQAPQLDYSSFASALDSTMNRLFQFQKQNASTKIDEETARGLGIENAYKKMEILSRIRERIANTDNIKLKNDYQTYLNNTFMESFNSDMALKRRNIAVLDGEIEAKQLQNAASYINLYWLPVQLQQQFYQGQVKILNDYYTGQLTKKQLYTETLKQLNLAAQTYGIKIDNGIKMRTSAEFVKQASEDTRARELANDRAAMENEQYDLLRPWELIKAGFDAHPSNAFSSLFTLTGSVADWIDKSGNEYRYKSAYDLYRHKKFKSSQFPSYYK